MAAGAIALALVGIAAPAARAGEGRGDSATDAHRAALTRTAASLSRVIGGASLAETSAAVAHALPSADLATVYLSAATDEVAYAVAAANAAQTNTVAIAAASTSDAATVEAQLAPFGPAAIRLVGPPSAFPASLIQSLATTSSVDEALVSTAPMAWTLAAIESSRRADVVVGNLTIAGSVELATTLAIATSASLLVLDGTEAGIDVATILDDPVNTRISVIGEGALSAANLGLSWPGWREVVSVN